DHHSTRKPRVTGLELINQVLRGHVEAPAYGWTYVPVALNLRVLAAVDIVIARNIVALDLEDRLRTVFIGIPEHLVVVREQAIHARRDHRIGIVEYVRPFLLVHGDLGVQCKRGAFGGAAHIRWSIARGQHGSSIRKILFDGCPNLCWCALSRILFRGRERYMEDKGDIAIRSFQPEI